ncbi:MULTISPECIES: CU044_2847 family protein [Actinoalloteichus]|uniref:Trypsin-co-occurring domain-containing protein n=1 Tax=Actinoalloteichus fjordicus TaxID=1612552 RepID=A0AAC9LD69_9PSEU|nr:MULTISPECIES: CU044_2847 family protein [Actinoalloteichus]APU14709.1 hypothetical protein UA74_13255 [Actinoalloteichus fjordicus]APU20677.1 hypothetical protein UA75_13335 [Actinoalloteichus sp. GBA129-24]
MTVHVEYLPFDDGDPVPIQGDESRAPHYGGAEPVGRGRVAPSKPGRADRDLDDLDDLEDLDVEDSDSPEHHADADESDGDAAERDRRLRRRVEKSIERIRRFGAMTVERISDMPRKPDKVTVEIAVKVSAEAGVVIARTSAEANFKIAVEWSNPAAPASAAVDDQAAEDEPASGAE